MPNPNPKQSEEFLTYQFKSEAGEELAKAALCVKLPIEIDAIVRPMANRSEFMRQAILEKLQRDGLLGDE
jgi:hypothetical protein